MTWRLMMLTAPCFIAGEQIQPLPQNYLATIPRDIACGISHSIRFGCLG